MKWATTPAADEDLQGAREWIELDNPDAAQAMLEAALDCFERLTQFPEMGAEAKLKSREFSGLRFFVLTPPFNRWIVFYQVSHQIEIIRVLYGTQNWRQTPQRFF